MLEKKILTIDFDGSDVRLLMVTNGRVRFWSTFSVPPEVMTQGLIKDPAQMGSKLGQFLREHRTSKCRVVTCVTGHRSVSRLFTLPLIKSSLLDEAVRRSAKQEMPLPLDETYLSWDLIRRENKQLWIFAIAVPREIIDHQVQALRMAKIKPRIMDSRPLALVRAIHKRDAMIVNLEEQGLGVVVVRNSVPVIIRSTPLGVAGTDALASLDKLAVELDRTTRFYDESHAEEVLNPTTVVYATGAHFDNPTLLAKFSQMVPYPLETPQPPIGWPKEFPVARYCANLGLALKKG